MIAVQQRNVPLVELLLRSGADPELTHDGTKSRSALSKALELANNKKEDHHAQRVLEVLTRWKHTQPAKQTAQHK